MHDNHINPGAIRARLRRAIDPCQILSATITREGKIIARGDAWRYRRESFSAALAMALSGVVSPGGGAEMATLLSLKPEGAVIEAGDEAAFADRAGEDAGRATVIQAAAWPTVGPAALVTLTLKAVET